MKKKILITLGVLGVAISTPTFAQLNSSSSGQSRSSQAAQSTQPRSDRDQMHVNSQDKADNKLYKQGSTKVAKVEDSHHKNHLQSSDLVGLDVVNDADNKIGTIKDLELSQDGRIEAVYLDIGGVLGIGATTYRVPFQSLQVHQNLDEPRVTMRADAINELAQLSEDLRDEMEDWKDRSVATTGRVSTDIPVTNAERSSVANANRPGTTGGMVGPQHDRASGESINPGAERNEQNAPRSQIGQPMSSESRQFVTQLQTKLQDNSDVATQARNLDVQVDRDRLILRGEVNSESARDDIIEAANEIAAGREVVDNIQIRRAGSLSSR